MPNENPLPASAVAPDAGLPRPWLNGMPLPWTTRLDPDGPQWKRIDLTRILHCQVNWACQVCGLPLARRAWVLLAADGTVLSDAALHHECMILARRWCPYLHDTTTNVNAVEIDYTQVNADGQPLHRITDYGDETTTWTVAHPPQHHAGNQE